MTPGPWAADFFVSYTGIDGDWAEWVAWTLRDAGNTVRGQAWDIAPGNNFLLEMQRFSTGCRRTVLVLSRHSVAGRPFVDLEWAAALAADPTGALRKLVPVRVDDCEPSGLLAAITRIDLHGIGRDAARERLLAGIRPPAPPNEEPPFPGTSSTAFHTS